MKTIHVSVYVRDTFKIKAIYYNNVTDEFHKLDSQ